MEAFSFRTVVCRVEMLPLYPSEYVHALTALQSRRWATARPGGARLFHPQARPRRHPTAPARSVPSRTCQAAASAAALLQLRPRQRSAGRIPCRRHAAPPRHAVGHRQPLLLLLLMLMLLLPPMLSARALLRQPKTAQRPLGRHPGQYRYRRRSYCPRRRRPKPPGPMLANPRPPLSTRKPARSSHQTSRTAPHRPGPPPATAPAPCVLF